MTAKGGVISFRVDASEMAGIREKAKRMPRKGDGRLPSSGDVAHRILREALQARVEEVSLEDVIKALAPDWSGNLPEAPTPVHLALPDGRSPAEQFLERQA